MYEKGSNLYQFERERFEFTKRWTNSPDISAHANEITKEAEKIVERYAVDASSEYICRKDMENCIKTIWFVATGRMV